MRQTRKKGEPDVFVDGDAYRVDIATGAPILLEGYTAPEDERTEEEKKEEMLTMSLSTDADTVAAGDEFTVYVNAANIPEAFKLTGIVATFGYDKNMFAYVEGTISLMDTFESVYGYGSYFQLTTGQGDDVEDIVFDGKAILLDTEPITIK